MELGLSTYSFPWFLEYNKSQDQVKSFKKIIENSLELNINLIQIADNFPLNELDSNQRNKVKKLLDESRIEVEIGMRGINSEEIKNYIEICNFFESKLLRLVISKKIEINKIVNNLKKIEGDLIKSGVILAIENHDKYKCNELISIIENFDKHIGICLDTVNSFGALEDFDRVLNMLAPYTANLHIKDFEIKRKDHNMGFIINGTPAGKGMLDISETIKIIKERSEYDFNSILEIWIEEDINKKQTLLKEERWVDDSINYLKNLSFRRGD